MQIREALELYCETQISKHKRGHGQYLIYHLEIWYCIKKLILSSNFCINTFLFKNALSFLTEELEFWGIKSFLWSHEFTYALQQDKTCRMSLRFLWPTERGLKFLPVQMLEAWSHRLLNILHISWILFPITKHMAILDFFFTGGMKAFISFKDTYWWSRYPVSSLNCWISSSK